MVDSECIICTTVFCMYYDVPYYFLPQMCLLREEESSSPIIQIPVLQNGYEFTVHT